MRLLTCGLLCLAFIAVVTAQSATTTTTTTTTTTSVSSTGTSGSNTANQINGLLASLGLPNLPIPQVLLDALNSLNLDQQLSSLDLNALLSIVPQKFLIDAAGLYYSSAEPACQAELMRYNNITNVCIDAFNKATSNLQDNLNTTVDNAETTNVNGTTLITLNSTDLRWGEICKENGPRCVRSVEDQVNRIRNVCGSQILSDFDFSLVITYWNEILCSQSVEGTFCYPAFVAGLNYINNGTVPDISGQQITQWCNDCTYKVLAGYSKLPEQWNLTGVMPLICSHVGSDYCLDEFRSISLDNVTDLENGQSSAEQLICSTCGQKIVAELHYISGISDTLDSIQSFFPCLSGKPINGTGNAQLDYCWDQIEESYPGSKNAPSLLTSPLIKALNPCITDFASGSCSDVCKAAIKPWTDNAGCCFGVTFDSLVGSLPDALASFIPKQDQLAGFISDSCGLSLSTGDCSLFANDSSVVVGSSSVSAPVNTGMGVLVTVDIPNLAYSWTENNEQQLTDALKSDLALASGGQITTMVIQSVEGLNIDSASAQGTRVIVLLPANDEATATQWQSAFETALTSGAVPTPSLSALPLDSKIDAVQSISISTGSASIQSGEPGSSDVDSSSAPSSSAPISSGAGSIPASSAAAGGSSVVSSSVASSTPASSIPVGGSDNTDNTAGGSVRYTELPSSAASTTLSFLGVIAMAAPALALVL